MRTDVIRNPRRTPRVTLRADGRIEVRGLIRRARLEDVGPGGCLIVPEDELAPRTVLSVLLMREDQEQPLPVVGRVAWTRRALTGIEFARSATPEVSAWFDRFIASRPSLREQIARVPDELSLSASLVRASASFQPRLDGDEAALFAWVDGRSPVGVVLGHTRLPRQRALAALFALLQKGIVKIPSTMDPRPPRIPVAAPRPGAELLRGVPGSNRPPAAQALLDASRAAASYERIGDAIALASQALKQAPLDREIASFLVALVRQGGA